MLLVLAIAPAGLASTNLSAWVFPGSSGRLLYQPDALGNRVLDASSVGYGGGSVPLPTNIPVKVVVTPVAGDNVANIQTAINQVQALPMAANGFRGVVLLSAGDYKLSNTVTISASGVILRGVGSNTNNGAVLHATASNEYTLVKVTGSGSASTVGSTYNITNNYVPAGARSFNVDNVGTLAVGQRVYVRRIATQQWINDLGMNLLGPPPGDVPWTPSGYNIDMDRVITHIEGNHIFVDAPITCAIDAHYTNGTIRQYSWSGLITNVAVEHLFGLSDYFGSNTNETHGWTFIEFDNVVNGWVRDVVCRYFGYSCVNLNSGDRFVTVQDCESLDPISIITGGRRYAFTINDAQNCLNKNCYTLEDRHQFVSESVTIGPDVFVDGLSDNAHAEAGPHQRWATGVLWDNTTTHGGNLDIQNAGNFGSGHGWEGANCTAWNCAASGFIVQNPPGAHNWLIGCIGPIQNGTVYVGPHDPGSYDSSGSSSNNVYPGSLYYAQLQDRLAAPNLQSRDYWDGDIYQFTNAPLTGDPVPVDAAWRSAIVTAAGAQAVDKFDIVTNTHWVPFTFNYTLAANEQIVGATLSLGMRAPTNGAANQVLYLGSVTNSFAFSALGWSPLSATNTTAHVLDLGANLSLLTNGKFNAAVSGDIGLDWAMLELQVATNLVAFTNILSPVADAYVRGGSSAALNFGTSTTLALKQDTIADNQQQAYLHWDLSGVAGTIYQAKVILTPVSVGTNAIEQGVAVTTNDTWTEAGLTWNNQPGSAGRRFASWIPAANVPVQFTVTPQVLDAMQGDKQLSLELLSLRYVGAPGEVDYASREYPVATSRPQLVLLVSSAPTNTPPVISAITNRSIGVNSSVGPIPFTIGDAETPAASLAVSGSSGNTTLVPNANIVFGGSGSNRTVTVTPAANQSGSAIITVTTTDSGGLAASDSFALTVTNSGGVSGTLVWNGPGAGINNWSAAANWSPAGPPGALTDVKFFDPGAAGLAVSNVNNYLDFGFSGIINSLQYGNTNGNHTTLISPGQTLTVNGGLTVGTETDNGSAQSVFATITGPGAALNMVNSASNLVVRQASTSSGGALKATLDLSGLDSFIANVSRVEIGSLGANARPSGTLYLAAANTITASGSSPAILIGGQGGGSGNGGNGSFLYLGQTNAIFANSISTATSKQGGCSMLFNPAFVSDNPVAYFRGLGGDPNRVSLWMIADSTSSGGTVNTTGTNDFTGGSVDALVDTMVIGRSSTGSGIGNPSGLLTFDTGTIDVNVLQIGYQGGGATLTNIAIGTVIVGNAATLIVNTNIELGHINSGGTNATRGILTINGGSVFANTIFGGRVTNTVSVNSGILAVTNTLGSPGAGIANLSLINSTFEVTPAAGAPAAVVTNLTTGGANQIGILSLPAITTFPKQYALIQYSGLIAGAGFNFTVAPLPSSYVGFISNNIVNGSVDLVITTNVPSQPTIANFSITGNSLSLSGTNGTPGRTFYLLGSTNLLLPVSNWTILATNSFDDSGNFSVTNSLNSNNRQQFYLLQTR